MLYLFSVASFLKLHFGEEGSLTVLIIKMNLKNPNKQKTKNKYIESKQEKLTKYKDQDKTKQSKTKQILTLQTNKQLRVPHPHINSTASLSILNVSIIWFILSQ